MYWAPSRGTYACEVDRHRLAGDEGIRRRGASAVLQEAYRHCRPVAAWGGDGAALLEAAGIPGDGPGVLLGDSSAASLTDELVSALGLHRVWKRAVDVMASAVPPAT